MLYVVQVDRGRVRVRVRVRVSVSVRVSGLYYVTARSHGKADDNHTHFRGRTGVFEKVGRCGAALGRTDWPDKEGQSATGESDTVPTLCKALPCLHIAPGHAASYSAVAPPC